MRASGMEYTSMPDALCAPHNIMEKQELIRLAGIQHFDSSIPQAFADRLAGMGIPPEWWVTEYQNDTRQFGMPIHWAQKLCQQILTGTLTVMITPPDMREAITKLLSKISTDTQTPIDDWEVVQEAPADFIGDRKSTRLNSSH